jgi:hypothetical protein
MEFVPMKWGAPVPRFGDAHVNNVVFLTQLKFKIHDLNEMIMVSPAKSLQNKSAEITAIPNLVSAFVKVSAVDVENVVVEGVRRVVVLDRKS